MNLRPYQEEVVASVPDKWALWFRQRVGKTPTAIRLASARATKTLVIVPKHIREQWEAEIALWKQGDTVFTVITKETFRRDAHILPAHDAVIIDEIHRHGANYKNLFHKALMGYITAHNVPRIWILSGTPYTASPWSVYSYGLILGKKWSWWEWSKEFFNQIKMGRRKIPVAKPGIEPRLQAILRSMGTVIDLKDVAEVPEDYEEVQAISLNSDQRKHIAAIEDFLPIVKYTKEHQLEQGVLKSDGYSPTLSFPCDKDKRLLELAEDEDKLVIVCRYLAQIEKYKKLLAPLGKPILAISGQEKETAGVVAKRANGMDKCLLLIQSDTCDGYNLETFDTMVFASQSYSYVNFDQIKFRMKATGKDRSCTYIYLITEGESIDRAVHNCVSKKEDFSVELYAKKRTGVLHQAGEVA
jgi:hypothetical protein